MATVDDLPPPDGEDYAVLLTAYNIVLGQYLLLYRRFLFMTFVSLTLGVIALLMSVAELVWALTR